jgi:hypothetical protein
VLNSGGDTVDRSPRRVLPIGRNSIVVHTYTGPLALGTLGFWADTPIALVVALIWAAHIGANRFVGYGLKFDSGFKGTHLSTQPAPAGAFTEANE